MPARSAKHLQVLEWWLLAGRVNVLTSALQEGHRFEDSSRLALAVCSGGCEFHEFENAIPMPVPLSSM